MSAPHRPDVVTRRIGSSWISYCLTCREQSSTYAHKPIADAWRRAHIKQAQTGVKK